MPYEQLEPISKKLTIAVGLTVVGFMAVGLALSFYRNVLFEQTLENLQEQNDALRAKIEQSKADLAYFRSEQYRDKYAKENLHRVRPGEKVIVISAKSAADAALSGSGAEAARQQEVYEEYLRELPVIEHWKMYLFHQDALERLKRNL
jgi:cell division protein FtsB